MIKDTTYSVVVKNFKEFSESINGELKLPKQSEISSGGATKYLIIEIKKDFENFTFYVKQTFAYAFNDPENLSIISGLSCQIEKHTKTNLYLHFGNKGFWKKAFKSNMINSKNKDFDKKYSAKSSNPKSINKIFQIHEIQDLFLNNKFLVFNVNTVDSNMIIKLKDMQLKVFTAVVIEKFFRKIVEINNHLV